MNDNCPCKNKKCPRHGNCDTCQAHHAALGKERPVACARERDKPVYKPLLVIVLCLIFIQSLFIAIKQIVFNYTVETLYSRSMVTLISMLIVLAVMVWYCRRPKYRFSVFPRKFSLSYIIITALAVIFYIVTLFFVNSFSGQYALMLLYGSIVTPVFEELLFRGVIWNKLNEYYAKEWKTFLTVSLLFALWHIGYAVGLFLWNGGDLFNIMIMKVLVGAIFGLITGAIRYKTNNCYSGILVHGIFNAIG